MEYTKTHEVFKAIFVEVAVGVVLQNTIMFCIWHILAAF
jgi:hypothetical protein